MMFFFLSDSSILSSSDILPAYFAIEYPSSPPAYNPASVPFRRKLTGPTFDFAQDWRKRLFSYSRETQMRRPRITSDSAHTSNRVLFTNCSCLNWSISILSPITRLPRYSGYNAEAQTESRVLVHNVAVRLRS